MFFKLNQMIYYHPQIAYLLSSGVFITVNLWKKIAVRKNYLFTEFNSQYHTTQLWEKYYKIRQKIQVLR